MAYFDESSEASSIGLEELNLEFSLVEKISVCNYGVVFIRSFYSYALPFFISMESLPVHFLFLGYKYGIRPIPKVSQISVLS